MSIRLNKAIRELNIGLQTAVEFLKKKYNLGDEKLELTSKLSDDQYHAMEVEFKHDAEVRSQAEKLFSKKPKEKKREQPRDNAGATLLEKAGVQQYKPLGKIDLDNVGKGPVTIKTSTGSEKPVSAPAAAVSPKQETAAADAKPATAAKAEESKPAATQPAAPKPAEAKPAVAQPATQQPTAQQTSTPKPAETKPAAEAKPAAVQPAQPKPAEPKAATAQPAPQQTATPKPTEAKPADTKPATPKPAQAAAAQAAAPKPQAAKPTDSAAAANRPAAAATTPAAGASATASTATTGTTTPPASTSSSSKPEIFQLKSEKKILNAPGVNVLGKIDLSAINQSTRPKKKSKGGGQQNNGNGRKKQRQRINKERVDINAVGKQVSQQQAAGNNQQAKKGNSKKKKNRGQKPLEVNEEDVARQVKETLARLTSKQSQNKKGAKYRREKREAVQERMSEEQRAASKDSKVLKLTEFVTVSELATMMNVPVTKVISTLMSIGIMASINQRLDAETINMVAEEFGFKTEYVSAEVQEAVSEEQDDEADLVPRAPIVTVMGHVDHGKTSLLDHIRNTNVIAGEAGGITQHIGAYSVTLKNGRKVTFLDTPGHEAFTAMRARGAQVTDIAIIIIAADDSVMPTTREAIAHAQAAGVPMVFAINKIDKPGANPDKIREDLANMNLLVEEWGGKYQCQEISAKKGTGVDELMEKVLLEADMLDLKANPNRKGTGTIIESSLDKGRGYVSTVLVSNGTLKQGDIVIAGTSWGRIKAMFNERNQRIEKAGPSDPAIILGLNGAPTAGDSFHVLDTEQEARDIANKREQLQREQGLRTQQRLTLGDISRRIAKGEFHELNIIVKGDVDGSVEALSDSFIKLSTDKVKVNVISKAVGQISENDVMLASASDAIIVGFQVRPSADARKLAEREGVEINTYSVIYDAIDDVRDAMEGMLDKVKKEIVTGQVEVKQVYKISKVGTVAGGLVTEGKVHAKDKCRVVRDGIVVRTANILALKRYKDDVKEVATGLECGISLVNYNDIQVGDILETFTEIEVEQKL